MTIFAREAANYLQQQAPGFVPKIGMVLGSGLGKVAETIKPICTLSYEKLSGFPVSTVEGHVGSLILGTLNGIPVACLQGRSHLYEGIDTTRIKTWVRTLKLIGCEILLLTNASGSLHPDMNAGSLMMLTDHINFQYTNPLIGPNDEDFGPRFLAMNNAYDPLLRARFMDSALKLNLHLFEGIYLGVTGPMYETPAEIRAFRSLGADAVGMSTVAEVIVARHCGLRVSAIAAITNLAAGLGHEYPNHEEVLRHGALAAHSLSQLILDFVGGLKNEKS